MKYTVFAPAIAASAVALIVSTFNVTASANTEVGRLKCDVAGGVGLVFGSTKEINCTFIQKGGHIERYQGRINKYGVDVGFTKKSRIIWAVIAAGSPVEPGALAGSYGGASAEATVVGGLGANVLVGGSSSSISLQPLSVQGQTGLNVAGGIAGLKLTYSGK
ncbi:MAG: DUF992 domain-containing protein [Hyphomicrobiales bacterium]